MSKRARNFGNLLRERVSKRKKDIESKIGPIVISKQVGDDIMDALLDIANEGWEYIYISPFETEIYMYHSLTELDEEMGCVHVPMLQKWYQDVKPTIQDGFMSGQAAQRLESKYQEKLLDYFENTLDGVKMSEVDDNDHNIICKLEWK
jgi:hypothetical protein